MRLLFEITLAKEPTQPAVDPGAVAEQLIEEITALPSIFPDNSRDDETRYRITGARYLSEKE